MINHNRFELIDVLRGLAVLQMMAYHFCFLLREFRIGVMDFYYNPFWFNFRILIVTQFLTIVGVSLKIAADGGLNLTSYFKRLLQLLIYGTIVIITSYVVDPERIVIFGILQFILIASIIGLLFVRFTWPNILLGILFCFIGITVTSPLFDDPLLNWFGLVTAKPVTLDYVPLLPWFGLVIIGIYIGHLMIHNQKFSYARSWQCNNLLTRFFALVGRHSLNLYMAHMPIFFGFIYFFLA